MTEPVTISEGVLAQIRNREMITPVADTPLTRCPTNLVVTNDKERAWLVNGCSPGDYEIEPGKPLHFIAVRYLVLPDSSPDEETGEIREFARVVLYDRNGHTFRTTGVAAPLQIFRIAQVYSREEWDCGIPLVITCRPSKRHKGASYHDIRIDLT